MNSLIPYDTDWLLYYALNIPASMQNYEFLEGRVKFCLFLYLS